MQHGSSDFSSSYYPHHYPINPSPTEFPPSNSNPIHPQPSFPSAASAPPYSHYYSPAPAPAPPEFSSYSNPYPQPPSDHVPATYNPPPLPQDPSYPHLQQPYYPYESHHPPAPATNYPPPPTPPNPNPAPYVPYDIPYDSHIGGGYPDAGFGYGRAPAPQEDLGGEGAYRYDGGRGELYGARGTGSGVKSSWEAAFDDYGRPKGMTEQGGGGGGKIVRAVPKMDTQEDVKNGVQKFRVKLLAEGGGQSTVDVLCQIGLDGIRMLDPSTNRTLRIYPLETVTRWEVSNPSIYTFWSKSYVDIEPRRIRLQSNSYTTSTILDTVTAATVQLKEMGGRDNHGKSRGIADGAKQSDQPTEKKKGLVDWMNIIKPGNEEKDHWIPDEAVKKCTSCGTDFGAFVRRHHCRNCGDIFCDKCTQGRTALTADEHAQPVRVCDRCVIEVSQRLSHAKEAATKPAVLHSHEDLARKLQEEMEKNKSSSGSMSSGGGSGRNIREVACPTCTVHLQVQVPTSGSETIECGVCQHPFLVSAH